MAKKGAKTKGYFKNLSTGKLLKFMFNPNTIKTSRDANYNTYGGCGSPYPLYQYVGGKEEKISFTLYLHSKSASEIKKHIAFLDGLMPSKNPKSTFKVPPLVYFSFGSSFTEKCVLTGYDKSHTKFDSKLGTTELTINVTLEVVK